MIYEVLQLLASASFIHLAVFITKGSDSGFGDNFGEVAPHGRWRPFSTLLPHNCCQCYLCYRVVLQQGQVKVMSCIIRLFKDPHKFFVLCHERQEEHYTAPTLDLIRITGQRCLGMKHVEEPTSHPSILGFNNFPLEISTLRKTWSFKSRIQKEDKT